MRRFVRHAASIPIEVRTRFDPSWPSGDARNVSHGGLAFHTDQAMEPGTLVEIAIPWVYPRFETTARVAWCELAQPGWELGVEFLSAEDAFRGRMVEQVCQIEQYRRHVLEVEGRELSSDEAAREWIARFGHRFPDFGSDSSE